MQLDVREYLSTPTHTCQAWAAPALQRKYDEWLGTQDRRLTSRGSPDHGEDLSRLMQIWGFQKRDPVCQQHSRRQSDGQAESVVRVKLHFRQQVA
jgi:hypothetical protein